VAAFDKRALQLHHQPRSDPRTLCVRNRYVGNFAPTPGVFPDYPAPVVRNAGTERELGMIRWGWPTSTSSRWKLHVL
jgi:hypothetical protein